MKFRKGSERKVSATLRTSENRLWAPYRHADVNAFGLWADRTIEITA